MLKRIFTGSSLEEMADAIRRESKIAAAAKAKASGKNAFAVAGLIPIAEGKPISAPSVEVEGQLVVSFLSVYPNARIFYTIDGSAPNYLSEAYAEPIFIVQQRPPGHRLFKRLLAVGHFCVGPFRLLPDLLYLFVGRSHSARRRATTVATRR